MFFPKKKKPTTFPKHLKFTLFQEARPQINTQKHHCCCRVFEFFFPLPVLQLEKETIQQKKGQGTINPVWGKPKLCTSASTSIQRYQLASLSLLSQRKCPRDGASIFWPPKKCARRFLHSSDMKQHKKRQKKKKWPSKNSTNKQKIQYPFLLMFSSIFVFRFSTPTRSHLSRMVHWDPLSKVTFHLPATTTPRSDN